MSARSSSSSTCECPPSKPKNARETLGEMAALLEKMCATINGFARAADSPRWRRCARFDNAAYRIDQLAGKVATGRRSLGDQDFPAVFRDSFAMLFATTGDVHRPSG